jgi:hypothetical protein
MTTVNDPGSRPGQPPAVTDDTPIGPDVDLSQEDIRLPSGTRLTNEMIPGLVEEIRQKPAARPGATATWPGIVEAAELLNFRIGEWHDFGYANPPAPNCKPIPPLGERSAEAIKGGHGAIKVIDEIVRDLYRLREQLVTELRTDEDVRAARVDAMLAEGRDGAR